MNELKTKLFTQHIHELEKKGVLQIHVFVSLQSHALNDSLFFWCSVQAKMEHMIGWLLQRIPHKINGSMFWHHWKAIYRKSIICMICVCIRGS